jgi:hypothetical protein
LAWDSTSKVLVILDPSASRIHYCPVSYQSQLQISTISSERCLYLSAVCQVLETHVKPRARSESPQANKKAKKSALKHSAHQPMEPSDQAALSRRAQRFQREHELERQKNGMFGGQASLKANYQSAHLFNNRNSRPASPSSFAPNADEPEADPVSGWAVSSLFAAHAETGLAERAELGSFYNRGDQSGDLQGLSPIDYGTPASLARSHARTQTRRAGTTTRNHPSLSCSAADSTGTQEAVAGEGALSLDMQSIQESTSGSDCASPSDCVACGDRRASLSCQVQRIKNEFTIKVYEIHARMALESVRRHQAETISLFHLPFKGDMVEYNQCQATLRTLYELGIPGGRVEEFTAYRILLFIHGRNKSGMFKHVLTEARRLSHLEQN